MSKYLHIIHIYSHVRPTHRPLSHLKRSRYFGLVILRYWPRTWAYVPGSSFRGTVTTTLNRTISPTDTRLAVLWPQTDLCPLDGHVHNLADSRSGCSGDGDHDCWPVLRRLCRQCFPRRRSRFDRGHVRTEPDRLSYDDIQCSAVPGSCGGADHRWLHQSICILVHSLIPWFL